MQTLDHLFRIAYTNDRRIDTTDELKKDIIKAVYKDINDQTEEMVEDLGCPRSFAEGLLKSIADNFKDETTVGKTESSYSSRHASTPEHEREARKASSDLLKNFNKKVKVPGNDATQSSLYSSRHISTQKDEIGAQAIVTKNEEKIREEMKNEKS